MIEQIVKDVLEKLNATPSRDFDHLIGIEHHIRKMSSMLCLQDDAVRIVGIWGPAGIGKTTIARALYNRLSSNFNLKIFMENVRGSYMGANLDEYALKIYLQEQFLSRIFNQEGMIIHHLGVIQERLHYQKVLIVLDDVNKLEQLEALANETRWFGSGSRIIVTTQDKELLRAHEEIKHIYEVDFPSRGEAIEIFSLYAFKQNYPPKDFMELAVKVMELSGYLPLGLRVLGSYMRGKNKHMWISELPRLRTRLDGRVEEVLRVGYDSLDKNDQAIFLHIACLFNGEDIDFVTQMLTKSDLDISLGLNILADKSLIQNSIDGKVTVHYLLQQMGKEVVRQQSIYEPGKRQFLSNVEEICNVLANDTGTRTLLGISLNISEIEDDLFVSDRAFEEMRNLLFLRFYSKDGAENRRLHLPRRLDYLPRLRLLHWEAYPMSHIPSKFRPECLVELRMQFSKLEKMWDGVQPPLKSLKRMDLSFSKALKELPDFSNATNLEQLVLKFCENLVTLPSSIWNLQKLKWLDMFSCRKLVTLPTNVNLASLIDLFHSECSQLSNFPLISTNIERLMLSRTAIEEVPSSIRLERLRVLDMSRTDIEEIPDLISCFPQLTHLDCENCRRLVMVRELPDSLSQLNFGNCDSLEMISRLCHNPRATARFFKCCKLNRKARAIIMQSDCGVTILPGKEVPAYFTHRTRGRYIIIHLDQRPLSAFSGFKACLVFATQDTLIFDQGITCRFTGNCGRPIHYHWQIWNGSTSFQRRHLCMLGSTLLIKDNNPQAEVIYDKMVRVQLRL